MTQSCNEMHSAAAPPMALPQTMPTAYLHEVVHEAFSGSDWSIHATLPSGQRISPFRCFVTKVAWEYVPTQAPACLRGSPAVIFLMPSKKNPPPKTSQHRQNEKCWAGKRALLSGPWLFPKRNRQTGRSLEVNHRGYISATASNAEPRDLSDFLQPLRHRRKGCAVHSKKVG